MYTYGPLRRRHGSRLGVHLSAAAPYSMKFGPLPPQGQSRPYSIGEAVVPKKGYIFISSPLNSALPM